MVDFGASEVDGVDLTTVNGFGTGTGGGFDAFALFGVTAVAGTAGDDTIMMTTTSDVTIDGRDGDDTLAGGAGDDSLMGGGGMDRFVFTDNGGSDIIGDFEVGLDLIDLQQAGISEFGELEISRVKNNTLINYGEGSVELSGVNSNQIDEDSFIFVA